MAAQPAAVVILVKRISSLVMSHLSRGWIVVKSKPSLNYLTDGQFRGKIKSQNRRGFPPSEESPTVAACLKVSFG